MLPLVEASREDPERNDETVNLLVDKTLELRDGCRKSLGKGGGSGRFGTDKSSSQPLDSRGEGFIAITIESGDELGELYINTQFEARVADTNDGQYNECQAGQNRVLLRNMDCLRTVLDELGGEEPCIVNLVAQPCPKTDVKVALDTAKQVLKANIDIESAIRSQFKADVEQAAKAGHPIQFQQDVDQQHRQGPSHGHSHNLEVIDR